MLSEPEVPINVARAAANKFRHSHGPFFIVSVVKMGRKHGNVTDAHERAV